MYNRDRTTGSNFYILTILEDSEEEGEQVGQIYSEDPIQAPDEGESFIISSFQWGGGEDVGLTGPDLEREAEDVFVVTDANLRYSIIEQEGDRTIFVQNTVLFVDTEDN